ncbi:MAG: CDP-diacylglycerol--serine O-phosphatidyltransferase, partial [Porticoccus sp.]
MVDNNNHNVEPNGETPQPVVDDSAQPPQHEKARHKGIFLLPNLFTTGAMFAGFYAILAGMDGKFEAASIAIFVA